MTQIPFQARGATRAISPAVTGYDTARRHTAHARLLVLLDGDEFRAVGVASTELERISLIAIDPERHPLHVWERKAGRTYASSGRALGATVFTNGPYMGRHTRSGVFARLVATGLGGPALGLATETVANLRRTARHPRSRGVGALLGGAVAGLSAGWLLAFKGWIPCGYVWGVSEAICDERDFHDEGRTHAWIGRRGLTFAEHVVGLGNPPEGFLEAMGGLIPLVLTGRLCSASPATEGFHPDYARAVGKQIVVAWGLVPIPTLPGRGILIVAATTRASDSARLGPLLVALGARDAVATDTSGCAILGRGSRFIIGPPPHHRQAIQRYGLCCRPRA